MGRGGQRRRAGSGPGRVGRLASEKKAREAFILSEYFSSRSRLKTVVRSWLALGLPSPVLMTKSNPKTSEASILWSLTA